MDLIISLALVVVISSVKILKAKSGSVIESNVVNLSGEVETIQVRDVSLEVGKNLMLRREPRAFYKILDEMGLK